MTETKPRPFDERAALEELERLAERIQATRRQRERAVADFNAFVKTFKDEDHATRLNALQAVPRVEAPAAAAPVPAPAPALAPPLERRAAEQSSPGIPAPAEAALPPPAPMPDSEPVPASWSAPRPRGVPGLLRSPRARIGIAVAVIVVAALLASWLLSGGGDESTAANPVAATPSPAPAAQPSPPAAARPVAQPTPVASTGAPRAVNVVLMTSRPVWTRVTVDDRKVIEREIPGAQTIPLGADRTIVIRAGDAGAIRLIVDGKDAGPMGRDGQIASRTFSAPAAR